MSDFVNNGRYPFANFPGVDAEGLIQCDFVRPEPDLVAGAILDGVSELAVRETAVMLGYPDIEADRHIETLKAILPFVQMMSDRLAEKYPEHKFVFAARDAEVLYDDFAIAHPDQYAVLLPASTPLIGYGGDFPNSDLAGSFLEQHGLGADAVKDNDNRFVFVDSGFSGSIAIALDEILRLRYGVPSLIEQGRLVIQLACSVRGNEHQIIPKFTKAEFAKVSPLLTEVKRNMVFPPKKTNLEYILAVAMQLLPRYQDKFTGLASVGERVVAVTSTTSIATNNWITRPPNINDSIVDPLAAGLVQYGSVRSALDRTGRVEQAEANQPQRKLFTFATLSGSLFKRNVILG